MALLTMEEQMVQMMELVEMAKLTNLIRENTLIYCNDPFWTFFVKQKNEIMIYRLD